MKLECWEKTAMHELALNDAMFCCIETGSSLLLMKIAPRVCGAWKALVNIRGF